MADRTPQTAWRKLATEAGESEAERAAKVSVAQAEKDLRAAGFDVAAERAKASALIDRLTEGAPRADALSASDVDSSANPAAWVAPTAPLRTLRPRSRSARWPLLVAATLAAATAGGVMYALGHRPKPIDPPSDVPHETPPETRTVNPPPPPHVDVPSAATTEPPTKPVRTGASGAGDKPTGK